MVATPVRIIVSTADPKNLNAGIPGNFRIIHSPPAAGRSYAENARSEKRLGKSVSAWSRLHEFAAGRLHITNFDANLARSAARSNSRNHTQRSDARPTRCREAENSFSFSEAQDARMIINSVRINGFNDKSLKQHQPNSQRCRRKSSVSRRAHRFWHGWPLGCEDSV